MSKYDGYGLLIDYKYCTNCQSCVVACQMEHGFSSDEFGIQVFESKPVQKQDAPMDDAWDWTYLPMPTWRCNLCAHRIEEGKKPMCVKHCLAACMDFGPIEELAKKALDMGDKVVIYKPLGGQLVDIGTIGPEKLAGDAYDPELYRREYDESLQVVSEEDDWENREYRIVIDPDKVSLDAFVALPIEDRIEFLRGEVVRGKTPEQVLDELGITMTELSNYDCVFIGRQAREIPKKNTI